MTQVLFFVNKYYLIKKYRIICIILSLVMLCTFETKCQTNETFIFIGDYTGKITPKVLENTNSLQIEVITAQQYEWLPKFKHIRTLCVNKDDVIANASVPFFCELTELELIGLSSKTMLILAPCFANWHKLRELGTSLQAKMPIDALKEPLHTSSVNKVYIHNSPADLAENFLSFFPYLKEVTLTNNGLTDIKPIILALQQPDSLKKLSVFQYDDYENIGVSLAEIPTEISLLQNLAELSLDAKKIYTMPEAIVNLSKLQFLAIDMPLTALPNKMSRLTQLSRIQFSNCQFKQLPLDFKAITSLTSVYFDECHNMEEDSVISLLPLQLQALTLDYCETKHIPKGIERLTSLTSLVIRRQCLDFSLENFSELQKLISLQTLEMPYPVSTKVEDIIKQLSILPNLKKVRFFTCEAIPFHFQQIAQKYDKNTEYFIDMSW